jgi:hypothetical protein
LEALAREGVDKLAAAPQVMINGKATGVDIHTDGVTNRKENVIRA